MEQQENRVAIITGGASGLGKDVGFAYARKGISLVLVDLNEDGLNHVKTTLQETGLPSKKILTIQCDLVDESSYELIINRTIETFGRIDILINSAGYVCLSTFEDLTPEMADKSYKVMLKAPLFLSQQAFPHLKETKGCIVNISSIEGENAQPDVIDYCVMKSGLEHLTRCTAVEGAPYGVRANCVRPGITRTPILEEAVPNTEKFYRWQARMIPIGRVGKPGDITEAIVYLTSDAASFVTGVCLSIDGGMHLASPWNTLRKPNPKL